MPRERKINLADAEAEVYEFYDLFLSEFDDDDDELSWGDLWAYWKLWKQGVIR